MKIAPPALPILNSKRAGFSLIEVAVALLIIGVILSIALPLSSRFMTTQALKKTQANQTQVSAALDAYFWRFKKLPTPSINPRDGLESSPQSVGYIPFKALGLTEDMTKDGNHRPMIYAAHPDLLSTYLDQERSIPNPNEIVERIQIKGASNQALTTPEQPVAYVLTSSAPRAPYSQKEQQNLKMDLEFYKQPYSNTEAAQFRMSVVFKTYPNLLGAEYHRLNQQPASQTPNVSEEY